MPLGVHTYFLQIENKGALCETIIRHDVLQKRKVYLDAIASGLEEFKVLSAMKCFPDLFMEMFVASDKVVTASDVLGVLKFPAEMSPQEKNVADHIGECLENLSSDGEWITRTI